MPTGVAIRDVRQQLFAAAERVLLRDGPSGLTSRAVTAEAGCAKGVLHRHFADFPLFVRGAMSTMYFKPGGNSDRRRRHLALGDIRFSASESS